MGTLQACLACLCVPFVLTLVLATMAFSVAQIIIGASHVNDCPKQYLIPVWLIGSGILGFLYSIHTGFSGRTYQTARGAPPAPLFRGLSFGMTLLVFGWFVFGNIVVLGSHHHYDHSDPSSDNYCNPLVMRFAFWSIVLQYLLLAISVCLMCCFNVCTTWLQVVSHDV